ncbi:hypothetical protein ATANTOWER_006815 [Ataeniobius toweri]|uniref:Uncharacterized protein n=1 Tax=Ataeniobius toweri TaxID=208326 RepID=A0ABU7APU1_9TELE|nr:hypothetical protein [Ataeniobius toweri]
MSLLGSTPVDGATARTAVGPRRRLDGKSGSTQQAPQNTRNTLSVSGSSFRDRTNVLGRTLNLIGPRKARNAEERLGTDHLETSPGIAMLRDSWTNRRRFCG